MKRRVILLFVVFVFFILVFFLQKILFVLMHGSANEGVSGVEMLQVLIHGLPIDLSVSGYLTAIPAFILIASVWMRVKLLKLLMNVYFFVALVVVAVVISVDVIVYSHWGFHLDPIVLFYMRNPVEVAASGSIWEWLLGTVIALAFISVLYYAYHVTIRKAFIQCVKPRHRLWASMVLVLLTGALFLPVRGGVTVSTMSISHAYFSDRLFLNHAAVNPAFNFFYLLDKQDDFDSQYQFYDKDEAGRIFNRLMQRPEDTISVEGLHNEDEAALIEKNLTVPSLLRIDHPNIIFMILESFSYDVATDSVIAPNMARFVKEGVFFENFYANSFRTDRGLASILSGYPAHPTTTILKYPVKTENLPSLPKQLRANGYENQSLYYGGDVKFANMRSYFVGSCGIQDILSDKDFPINKRLTKWGVPDEYLIDKVYHDLTEAKPKEPFLKVVLTLSSHEPFDVPTKKFDLPFLNAVNYTDECVGRFVADLKASDLWDNTLIVFVSDHAMQGYPQGIKNYEKKCFHIPMLWIGGAVRQPMVISDYGSQNDLAATLLSQLHIDYSDFIFSKDMLQPQGRKFSFYAYVNGFCMMDASNVYLYDNNQKNTLLQTGDPAMEKEAKAFFQLMYIDLGSR